MILRVICSLVLLCIYFCRTDAVSCPHEDVSLSAWSREDTWASGKVPDMGEDVVISKPILLDTSPPTLSSITVQAGGKLVWSPNGDFSIRTKYILIETDGEMHIGSEDCKFQGRATITLLGEPGELDIPGFGEKFIGVKPGGTLELHGRDKLSWTKLTKTAKKVDDISGGLKYRHREEDNTRMNGIYAYHFKPDGMLVERKFVRLNTKSQRKENRSVSAIKNYLRGIPDGDVIAMATQGNVVGKHDSSHLFDLMDDMFGPNNLRNLQPDDAYVLITHKGSLDAPIEDMTIFNNREGEMYSEASVQLKDEANNALFIIISRNMKVKDRASYVDFIVLDEDFAEPIIDVTDDVRSWDIGDKIFITSTDYDWKQVEEFYKVECQTCTANQIRLNKPLLYTHYGDIYKKVDMRAEVGLMTRNILIQGEVSLGQTNGGHVKFLKGFKSVRVEGVELTKMGQPLILGRYPLHYHMCEDLDDSLMYPIRSYIRGNSIHHTNFRCVTLHGTHGAQLINNVCYDTFGHGFFLEDGGEKRTYFDGNLALGQRKWTGLVNISFTGAIPTDKFKGPVSFWLTNPQTTLVNNVAAGGDGVGYWFVYPDLPTGPSKNLNFMAYKEARHTKITKFENNVAHSYVRAGLFVDNIEEEDLTVKGYNKYNAKEDPTNRSSKSVAAVFSRLTAYKNRFQNVWIRGSKMMLSHASLADSAVMVTMLREQRNTRFIKDSVIIGESDNIGEPTKIMLKNKTVIFWPRSLPSNINRDRIGIRFSKGALQVENVWFDGFQSTEFYKSSALGFRHCSTLFSPLNKVANVKFGFSDSIESGNRVYTEDCQGKGFNHFLNTDSSLKDSSGDAVTIISSNPFYLNSQCRIRTNWNMAFSPLTYGKINFNVPDNTDIVVMRTDAPYYKESITKDDNKVALLAILGESYKYLAYVNDDVMPDTIQMMGKDITRKDTVVMGVCIPRDATFEFSYKVLRKSVPTTEVSSMDEVDNDNNGGKFYFDAYVGAIFFKMIQPIEGGACPRRGCSVATIEIISGDLTDTDCTERFLSKPIISSPVQGVPLAYDSTLPADSVVPPSGWGAGATR